MRSEVAVEVRGLAKSYGAVEVLTGVDLTVEAGTVFALLGANGAGKTTTVRILATLTRPDAGRARVAGFDVVTERAKARAAMGLTGQYVSIDGMQTGAENLHMIARLAGLRAGRRRHRVTDLLERFELADAAARRVSTYSGGMRRRLDLAASLLREPRVLFLDEPTTGLDPRSRQVMWATIADLASHGMTVFLTTQYLEEADRLADRVAFMAGGRVVADDTPTALKERFSRRRLDLVMTDSSAYERVVGQLASTVVTADPMTLTASVAAGTTASEVRDLLDFLDPGRRSVRDFSVHTASLDDVFLALTGSGDDHRKAPAAKDSAHV